MNPISVLAIAFAMSTDAFAAAIAKGAALQRPSWREALRTGAIFGIIEAITPLVGWLIGSAAAKYASEWDHWIAFTLLAGLGARMVWVGLRPNGGGRLELDKEWRSPSGRPPGSVPSPRLLSLTVDDGTFVSNSRRQYRVRSRTGGDSR